MTHERISAKQLKRYYEETEGQLLLSADVSDRDFHLTHEFEACDTTWNIELHGTEFDTIGFNLTNLSSEPMRTKYEVIVKNQSTGDDHNWRDPDGLLIFSPHGTVDDTWGTDEIISYRTLTTVTGLCVKNIAKILVKISIFNTTEEVNEKRRHDLRLPMEAKIDSLLQKGSYKQEFIQQDMLISRRLSSFEATGGESDDEGY